MTTHDDATRVTVVDSVSATSPSASHRSAGLPEITVGTRIGRYVIQERIGAGGMGVVFRAHDPRLGREVALKCLRPEYVARHGEGRLLREARALAQLSHPNVVAVFGVEHEHGGFALAMEHVSGQTLRQWFETPRPWQEFVEHMLAAGRGLAAAHAAGLVHRDFKPSNVLVGHDGRVRVMDFGLVRATRSATSMHPTDGADGQADDPHPAQHLAQFPASLPESTADDHTAEGVVMGTIAYMAPEQHRGDEADPRSDQFAFCVSLWEALCRRRPFSSELLASMRGKLAGPPPWPSAVKVPPALVAIVQRGLAPHPDDRWPSMEILLRQLERLRERRRLALPLLSSVVALGLLGLAMKPSSSTGFDCSGAEERLAGIWDSARATEIREALQSAGAAHLEETWPRLEPRLQAHADRWSASYTEACEATHVRLEASADDLDRRMGCLERARVELEHAIELLSDPSGVLANDALRLVDGLPRPAECLEPFAPQRDELPMPSDPTLVAEVQQLRIGLTEVKARQRAKAYDEALTMLAPLLERARATGHGPIEGAALFRRGLLHDRRGDYSAAYEDLSRAHTLAVEHDYPILAQQAASQLAFVLARHMTRPEDAMRWAQTGVAEARRIAPESTVEADALGTLAVVLHARGRYGDAVREQRRALELLQRAWKADPEQTSELEIASAMDALGNMVDDEGRSEESVQLHREALAIQERELGPNHLDVATSLNNLASALIELDRNDEARPLLLRCLEIREKSLGSEHPMLVSVVNNLGILLEQGDDPRAATPYLERALSLSRNAFGEDHPHVGSALLNLGRLHQTLGEPEAARRDYQRSLDTWERSLGDRHPKIALAHASLGDLALEQGAPEEAAERHARALAIRTEVLGEEHPLVASSHVRLGRAQLALGRTDDALASGRWAMEALSRRSPGDPELEADAKSLVERATEALAHPVPSSITRPP
ncbi:serine/threonine-protein kinase [Paraliomyxa miuraensis]|uniref:serine/threonine-protein kinase n=1 Tax=Paraliomyxa miuraensis TaxID=376150 RepID=UPI002256A29C|nr:serine/threonine-protein kinase [Paraliomyxa miuraensis]MCX4243065.1 serine/threonine-protein kinase [Paraliomyxa miuraensis]